MVIRVADIERSKNFYAGLGLSFRQEQHGDGPVHYASEVNGVVIELYPASRNSPVSTSIRLGFSVDFDVLSVARIEALGGRIIRRTSQQMTVADPDGINIDLNHLVQ